VIRLAVASVPFPTDLDHAVRAVVDAVRAAAEQKADLLCLPEACLPGHRLGPLPVRDYRQSDLDEATFEVGRAVRTAGVVTVLGAERVTRQGRVLLATVLGASGTPLGHQVKTQIAPEEEAHYVPGSGRQVFHATGVTFGVTICHEAFRHPETVRSTVLAGAQIVLHPHYAATDTAPVPTRWGDADNPYYEAAIRCRAIENTVFMASANYALPNQASASAVISPEGILLGHLPYGRAGTLVVTIDPTDATGAMARRYRHDRDRFQTTLASHETASPD
jgi:predicted amidohydrolase